MTQGTCMIETGKTYLVTHPWKGIFALHVRRTDRDFTGGIVLDTPTSTALPQPPFFPPGSEVIVLNGQCTFRPCDPLGTAQKKEAITAGE